MTTIPDSSVIGDRYDDPGPYSGGSIAAYCAVCRYGVSIAAPGVCPMCRGTDWVVPLPVETDASR